MEDKKRMICDLAHDGKQDQINELSQHPDYLCFTCGRLADKEDSLCNPVDVGRMNPGGVLIE
jgi:hypothetical protein